MKLDNTLQYLKSIKVLLDNKRIDMLTEQQVKYMSKKIEHIEKDLNALKFRLPPP